jgi:hypothetical protein
VIAGFARERERERERENTYIPPPPKYISSSITHGEMGAAGPHCARGWYRAVLQQRNSSSTELQISFRLAKS